jgi:hypothetical protein
METAMMPRETAWWKERLGGNSWISNCQICSARPTLKPFWLLAFVFSPFVFTEHQKHKTRLKGDNMEMRSRANLVKSNQNVICEYL